MKNESQLPRIIALLLLGALLHLAATHAIAQPADDEKYIGAGLRVLPAYEGADRSRVEAIPCLRLYGQTFFARTTQGILEAGGRTQPAGGLIFGAQLAYEEGRLAADSTFLQVHHLGDLHPGASVGLQVEGDWKIGAVPLNALLRFRQDVDPDNGAAADLRVTAGVLDWHGVRAGLYGQLTWGDDKSMQRYFGLTPAQSAASGLGVYRAGSGLRNIQVGLLGEVDLAKHWIALWGVKLLAVQGAAADSPLVRQRTNWSANTAVAYRF